MSNTSNAVRARMIQGVRKTSTRPPAARTSHSHGASIAVPKTSARFSSGIAKYQAGAVTALSATDQRTTAATNSARPTGNAKISR